MNRMNEILGSMPSAKEEVKQLSNTLYEYLISGISDTDKLRLFATAKAMQKSLDDFLKMERAQEVFLEAMRGADVETFNGMTIKVTETGVKYDYKVSDDWNDITSKIDALTEQRKALEETLKNVNKGVAYLDKTTGAFVESVPRSAKTILKLELK